MEDRSVHAAEMAGTLEHASPPTQERKRKAEMEGEKLTLSLTGHEALEGRPGGAASHPAAAPQTGAVCKNHRHGADAHTYTHTLCRQTERQALCTHMFFVKIHIHFFSQNRHEGRHCNVELTRGPVVELQL